MKKSLKQPIMFASALAFCFGLALLYAQITNAAATYTINTQDKQNAVITPVTSGVVTVVLADADYTLVHLNIQNDGSTASVSTDYIVMQPVLNPDGTAVSIDASYTDGNKMIVAAGAAATFNASVIPKGTDGPFEVQIKAVGHGCKAQLIRGHHQAP